MPEQGERGRRMRADLWENVTPRLEAGLGRDMVIAMKLWIGTSGFQYPEWKGKFYPEKMPASKMLPYYAGHFSSTEVNYTFRQIPSEKTILNWCGATPEAFKFSFKAPQRVTHFSRLREC